MIHCITKRLPVCTFFRILNVNAKYKLNIKMSNKNEAYFIYACDYINFRKQQKCRFHLHVYYCLNLLMTIMS